MSTILELIEIYPIISIISLVLTVLGLIFSVKKYFVNKDNLKVNKSNYKRSLSNFSIYTCNCFSIRSSKNESCKILLYNVNINNASTTRNTFSPSLTINYKDRDNNEQSLQIDHNPKLNLELPNNKLRILERKIRVLENDIENGWLLFKQPVTVNSKFIVEYTLQLLDPNEISASSTNYIISEITHAQ